LGGARSGKSRYGLSLAVKFPAPRLFVATAEAGDAEMAARIERHQRERGPQWHTREVPLALAETITATRQGYGVILVDCLTLWLSNLMAGEGKSESDLEAELGQLLDAVAKNPTPLILISNEVSLGIVPENPLARLFRDLAGLLHQRLAQAADLVTLMVAGLPVRIKGG
jgi:adenosylcobinamide kinase/adenosylcobinamide-phosphate guanylyltransferase